MPPSIDSLELPPFKPRFPWWGADLQTLSVLLQSPASDMAPHTSERVCFPMADRTGDILLGMLDRPEEPMANGEYAVVQFTPGKSNMQIWDFAVKAAK